MMGQEGLGSPPAGTGGVGRLPGVPGGVGRLSQRTVRS